MSIYELKNFKQHRLSENYPHKHDEEKEKRQFRRFLKCKTAQIIMKCADYQTKAK